MESYSSFAQVYDLFMDNVPYEKWHEFIVNQLQAYGIEEGLVLDLGCGTGVMTRLLQASGYDMIGVDRSYEMLAAAREADPDNGGILYLCQDMCEFELYGTVRAIVSVCDSLNYITDPEDLQHVFSLVHNYLDLDGLFLFDMNTIYKYEQLLAEATFAENREEGSFIWENLYDAEERLNEYAMTFYIKNEQDTYERHEEFHYERAYTSEEITLWLEQAGFQILGVYDDYTELPLQEESERMCFVVKKVELLQQSADAMQMLQGSVEIEHRILGKKVLEEEF